MKKALDRPSGGAVGALPHEEVILVPIAWDDIGGLADAHERFLSGAPLEADVRGPVLDSWKRCRLAGLEPHRTACPHVPGPGLDDRFLHAAEPVLGDLTVSLDEMGVTVVLCDGEGRMVQRRGGGRELLRCLDKVSFTPGCDVSESVSGTNGVGTALTGRRPFYVAGREHFADFLVPFACAGAPVRDPLSGRIEAVVDLTCLRKHGDPAMLRLVREAARSIETRLLEQATERERALLAAYWRARHGALGWSWPGHTPPGPGTGHRSAELGPVDLALLREKAEALIASPEHTLDEVVLPGGRVATLRCRPVTAAAGGTGVVVEARIRGGPGPAAAGPGVPAPPRAFPATAGTSPSAPSPASPPVAPGTDGTPPAAPHTPVTASPSAHGGDGPHARARPGPDDRGGSGRGGAEQGGDAGGWPLLVGETGVSRLAVQARRRLELLHDAALNIGSTLDVTRTAEELAEVAVPRFADFTAVDLPGSVLDGEEPEPFRAGTVLRRVALGAVHKDSSLYDVGAEIRFAPLTPQARSMDGRQPVLEPVLAEAGGWLTQDPARSERILAAGIHSLITVPLQARGATLGVVSFYRSAKPAPFEDDDLALAQELAARAAICIDNARRYTREHNTVLALQRSLLPRGRPEENAVDVAFRYLPARTGVSGDWFDVIPLSGARVALVVGDVVGHGLHAVTTMGRLRTAVHNFCSLDMPADDLLAHLDDLVCRLDRGEGWMTEPSHQGSGIIGATCLLAVYDPVSRRCTFTHAGHPRPAVVAPDGTVTFVDLPPTPPLGLGGTPFETVELEPAEGSRLVLYTDGLIERRSQDAGAGLDTLRTVLARAGQAPEDTCEAVLGALLPDRPDDDDVVLLVARTHALGPERVAQWDLPEDPTVVSRARAAVTAQLAAWGLDELAFTTELVASELVTNALRHATGPVRLRLLWDRALVCEVSDGSSTSPRLRRARSEDEGGRGLFLVSQLTERWGTRYTADGKVIWVEQPLP
ncbi:protein phosphatase [Streptomyces sp. F-3]|uniref:SpoIIE family protein phosphatase n=1 Tax=Streptomyces TaxID=1883 RepID=UPI0007C340B3|nr:MULTISPECIES: SpoIIE family protein phosphatase [Streptomyces]MDN5385347.1 SpoIIE family protein phosphatase [Streptomyces sp. LB8]GAT81803.1 protein phosphatase [Streptomyces sp. F-3]